MVEFPVTAAPGRPERRGGQWAAVLMHRGVAQLGGLAAVVVLVAEDGEPAAGKPRPLHTMSTLITENGFV